MSEELEKRIEKAVEYKHSGYNCAQAVAAAYADKTNMFMEDIFAITQGFGTGIGGSLEGNCGAISGACVIAGLMNKNGNRMETMKNSRKIITSFKEQNGSVICKELKGIGTGKVLRECDDCVRDAVKFLGEIIGE